MPSSNVVSQKHPSHAQSAGLLAFHAVLSIDILPTRLTGSGHPDCCCVSVAGVVFAAVSGMKTQVVLRHHAQSFPMGRYAGPWLPSCWMTCRYRALQTIWALLGTLLIALFSKKVSACFLMTQSGLRV